jgi:hypothetical protein
MLKFLISKVGDRKDGLKYAILVREYEGREDVDTALVTLKASTKLKAAMFLELPEEKADKLAWS